MKDNVNGRRNWQEFPQVGHGKLYAALKPSGFISISGWTHERMGSPDGYLLLFDRANRTIGLKAARLGVDRNAYRATRRSGPKNYRTIQARALCEEFGIAVEKTVAFQNFGDRSGWGVDIGSEQHASDRTRENEKCRMQNAECRMN